MTEVRFCPRCGTERQSPEAAFCMKCGLAYLAAPFGWEQAPPAGDRGGTRFGQAASQGFGFGCGCILLIIAIPLILIILGSVHL